MKKKRVLIILLNIIVIFIPFITGLLIKKKLDFESKNKDIIMSLSIFIVSLLIFKCSLLINKKDNDCTDCHTEYVESIGTTKEINLLDNMNMEKYVYDNYVFTDMYVICSSNRSEFDGYVMNLNSNTNKDLRLKITLFDKDNKEIYYIKTEIYELEFGKKRDFFSQINRDISNAYSFKVEEY